MQFILNWINNEVKEAILKRFTGSIQINFYEGGLVNINVNQSKKPPKQ